ncbi:hypothetical protein CROQUDRAFT_93858 [Cronartium quercuum f. sp. fusiforme G11]|uniref:Uncharacterized protein n=1 Tax=Cronartium quercuum f. sp. fusiforme G11 TaxID=708437 RepID=A0A9P6NKS7_9BASI|nr:hypothetical protein CROQUDRAFT_93858 [Cronartium quercuum f. sp. fusiforme G11]
MLFKKGLEALVAMQAPYLPKTKVQATINQKLVILDWHHAQPHPNQSATAGWFQSIFPELKIKQLLISKWLKNEAKIQQQALDTLGGQK